MAKERKVQQRKVITNTNPSLKNIEGKEDKKHNMETFELNFNGKQKSIKVKLEKSEDIFLLAEAFSKWLTKNKITNTLTEHLINENQESKNQRN